MPITVFATKGISGNRRERIEAAVVAGGAHTSTPYEAWIMADPSRSEFKVLITGPLGFLRAAVFAMDEKPATIKERIREMIEEY
jgi:hypothetical protein